MDVYVILDAIVKCVSAEEKELCRIAELALTFMVDSASTIVGDREKVCMCLCAYMCVYVCVCVCVCV